MVLDRRVSTRDQEKDGTLESTRQKMRGMLLKLGFTLGRNIFIFEGCESSRIQDDRLLLEARPPKKPANAGPFWLPSTAIGSYEIGSLTRRGSMNAP